MGNSSSGGIGFLGLLTVAFVVLKLIGQIDWSWWWIFSPILIPASIGVLALILVVGGLTGIFEKRVWNKFFKNLDKRSK